MDRKVEKDGVLWFVAFCGGCPFLKKRKNAPPVCKKVNRIVADVNRVLPECPLEMR